MEKLQQLTQNEGEQAVKYTEGHKRVLLKAMNDLQVTKCCLFCGHKQLNIGDVIDTTEYNDGISAALIQGASHIPFVQIVCARCGFAHLFNAIALGVVDQETGKLKESDP
jgi:predicted nucleic-acid-binding Zn-ribbon protein